MQIQREQRQQQIARMIVPLVIIVVLVPHNPRLVPWVDLAAYQDKAILWWPVAFATLGRRVCRLLQSPRCVHLVPALPQKLLLAVPVQPEPSPMPVVLQPADRVLLDGILTVQIVL